MKLKTNTNLFNDSTIVVTYTIDKSIGNYLDVDYYPVKPRRLHRDSSGYGERITKSSIIYKIYKNLLLEVKEDYSLTQITYDII